MGSTKKRAVVLQKTKRPFLLFASLALVFPLIFLWTVSVLAETSGSEAAKEQLRTAYGRLPLSFEANRGQTDGQVKFL